MGAPAVVEHRWEYCEEDAEKLESSQPDGSWLASTVQGSVEDGVEASEPWVDAVHQRQRPFRVNLAYLREMIGTGSGVVNHADLWAKKHLNGS
jgi:hypothetical protein